MESTLSTDATSADVFLGIKGRPDSRLHSPAEMAPPNCCRFPALPTAARADRAPRWPRPLPRFLRRCYVAGMELWRVEWVADSLGYQVLVLNRCRVAGRFEAESLAGQSLAETRVQAAAKAVEIALERRVPLKCVREGKSRYQT